MALTEIYVDPSIAANTGSGTIGDPYGDLQHALNTMTRDATNGDRLNIKAGTAEVMASAISLATYGTPGALSPLVIQGYTAAAGDGGIGEINNGGANVSIINSATLDFIHFADMKLGNTGTAQILVLDQACSFANVEFHTSSAANAVTTSTSCTYAGCRVHSVTGNVAMLVTNSDIDHCNISYGVSGQYALSTSGQMTITNNIVSLTNNARGILTAGTQIALRNNSVYSATGGTGIGITMGSTQGECRNCIVEGFSGAGGKGIVISAGCVAKVFGNNAYYNNTTNVTTTGAYIHRLTDITLTSAPFTNAGGGDFSIATAAKAELQAQGWPSSFNGISTNQFLDPGAAQIEIDVASGAHRIFGGLITG